MQQVRQSREKIVELVRDRGETRLARAELLAERADLALQRFDVAAGRFGAADRLRALIARLAQALDARLQLLALGLEPEIARAIELEATAREIGRHGVEVLAKKLRVEHGMLA